MAVVRVAPVARVNWDSASRFVAAACEVLAANRRIGRGNVAKWNVFRNPSVSDAQRGQTDRWCDRTLTQQGR